jgi:hypothetical protein
MLCELWGQSDPQQAQAECHPGTPAHPLKLNTPARSLHGPKPSAPKPTEPLRLPAHNDFCQRHQAQAGFSLIGLAQVQKQR